jgi:hypothetical protein
MVFEERRRQEHVEAGSVKRRYVARACDDVTDGPKTIGWQRAPRLTNVALAGTRGLSLNTMCMKIDFSIVCDRRSEHTATGHRQLGSGYGASCLFPRRENNSGGIGREPTTTPAAADANCVESERKRIE